MKRIQYVLSSLVIALLLFTVGCSKSEENKNTQANKVEKIDKIEKVDEKSIHSEEIDMQHNSSIENLMPEKWKVINSRITPVEKLDFYSRSFGGKVVNFENNSISSSEPNNYYKFQINIIKAYDISEAKKIF